MTLSRRVPPPFYRTLSVALLLILYSCCIGGLAATIGYGLGHRAGTRAQLVEELTYLARLRDALPPLTPYCVDCPIAPPMEATP